MSTTYDLGDGVRLTHKVYVAGVLTSATVTLTVTKPDGTTLSPTVTQLSTGVYEAAEFVVDQLRIWDYVWSVSGTTTEITAGQFTVGAPAPTYVDVDTLRDYLGLKDTSRDWLLDRVLRAVSRAIERACGGRRFYADAALTMREYRLRDRVVRDDDGELLLVDDIADDTGLVVELGRDSTWTAVTNYLLEPDNALARGEPITALRRDLGMWVGRYVWGTAGQRVRITARWGWPQIPDDVEQATLIQASRLYKRKDSPEGVMGNAEWGVIRLSRVDPDVKDLLGSFGPGAGVG